MKTNRPVLKVVLIVWVLFSILYVGYTQYKYFTSYVAQSSYQKGLSDAVAQVIQQAQACKPFPVTYGQQGVNLMNTACNGQGGAQQQANPNTPNQ
jgi:hypothetical protein